MCNAEDDIDLHAAALCNFGCKVVRLRLVGRGQVRELAFKTRIRFQCQQKLRHKILGAFGFGIGGLFGHVILPVLRLAAR